MHVHIGVQLKKSSLVRRLTTYLYSYFNMKTMSHTILIFNIIYIVFLTVSRQ